MPLTNSLKMAPFTSSGSLLHWADSTQGIWVPNDSFYATLRIDHMTSRYSGKYVVWKPVKETDARSFPMFIADLIDLLQRSDYVSYGVVSAEWKVRKRGKNYGLCLA